MTTETEIQTEQRTWRFLVRDLNPRQPVTLEQEVDAEAQLVHVFNIDGGQTRLVFAVAEPTETERAMREAQEAFYAAMQDYDELGVESGDTLPGYIGDLTPGTTSADDALEEMLS